MTDVNEGAAATQPRFFQRIGFAAARFVGRQEWLRLGIRRRMVSKFFPPSSTPPWNFDAAFRGWRYRGNVANTLEWHIYFFGGYELKELALMDDIAARIPNLVALDVGANLGGHSLSLAKHAAHVHAFEPFGPLADRIDEHIRLNRIPNITVHRIGLGDARDERPYYLNQNSRNLGTGSFLEHHNFSQQAATLSIDRGDHVLESLKSLDFMKIDVEGYEALVLVGLRHTLAVHEPVIMMEVTASTTVLMEERGGLDALLPFAFTAYRVENPRYLAGLVAVRRYRLEKIGLISPRTSSYNILIVPRSREDMLGVLTEPG